MKTVIHFTTIILVTFLLPLTASAYDFMVDGLCYNRNADGTSVTVTYQNSSSPRYSNLSGGLDIPANVTYNGTTYSVTTIGEYAFEGCWRLKSASIPNSVTSIGSRAFGSCSVLTSVTWNAKSCQDFSSSSYGPFYGLTGIKSFTFGNEVEKIPSYLCYGLTGLTSVTIPNSITTIGKYAFYECSGLTSVTWNAKLCQDFSSSSYGPFYGLTGIKSFTFGNEVEKIPSYLCSSLTSLTSVTIPNSVTSIGERAFSGCSGLTSVNIPYSVTTIGKYAFYGCSSLTSVTIPNSVTSIGEWAFYGCSGLTSVHISDLAAWCGISFVDGFANPLSYAHHLYLNGAEIKDLIIPNSVTKIGNYAFDGCSGLTSVTIGNSVTSIGGWAFCNCSGLTSVNIPNSVTTIGNSAFKGCSGLTSVTWNAKSCQDFSSSSYGPFYGLTGIKSFTFGNEVEKIPSYLCYGLTGLTSVTIPNSVTSIGSGAFYECSGLTSVTIPNSVTSIGGGAFYECSGLTSVTIPNSVTTIGERAFSGCSGLTSVNIPNSVTTIGKSAFYECSGLTSVHISDLAAWCGISFLNGYANPLFYAHHLYLNGTEIKDLDIPNSVTSIKFAAFYNCNSLTSMTIPSSVTSIGKSAFYSCSGLTSVTIPNSVTTIGDFTFGSCSGLTSVTIGNSVITIGKSAFIDCSSLKDIHSAIENPANVSLGDSVFNNVPKQTCVLHVPVGTVEAYCVANQWKDFDIIVDIQVNSIEFEDESISVYVNGQYQLQPTILPDNATKQVLSWSSSDTNVATVDNNGMVTGRALGTTTITATTTDGTNLSATCEVTVTGITEITMNKETTSIYVSASEQLTATVTPADAVIKTVSWSSSDTNVATVDENGMVIGCAIGTATITASATDGSGVSASCVVTVTGITEITMNKETTSIYVSTSEQLTATVTPADVVIKTVSWSSSDTNVATVDENGMVIGCAIGTATITASATDGSGVSASCVVTVTGITGITFNKTATTILVGNSETLSATVTPSDVINKTLNWTSSNTAIATVDQNGKVTAITPGTATITVSATDGSGVSASCVVTVLNGFELTAPLVLNLRGEEATYDLAVELRNEVPITALQFVMTVPDGFALATDSYGDYEVWLDDARKTRSHTVSVVPYGNSGKAYQVIISSPTNQNLKGNDGALVHFSILGEKYPQTIGYSKMAYTHIVAADANETQYNLPDAESDLVNGYIVGDANADARVDVGDYVVTANYMLNRSSETPFFTDAANAAQGDAEINVTDLVAITNIGLEIRGREIVPALPSAAPSLHRMPVELAGDDIACELSVDDISGDLTTVSLAIDNDAPLAALQCDIELPGHITVADAAVTSRSARHSVAFNRLETGATRLLLSSSGTNDIAAGEGAVVTLTLRGQVQAGDLLTVGNLLMAERDLTTHGGADLTIDLGELSEVKGVATDRIAIYGRDGHIVIDSPAAGTAQLIWPNGISQELKVVAGRNTYPMATGGICFVRFGHEVKKLKF